MNDLDKIKADIEAHEAEGRDMSARRKLVEEVVWLRFEVEHLRTKLQRKDDRLAKRLWAALDERDKLRNEVSALKQALEEMAELNYNLAQGGPNARYVYDLKQEVVRLRGPASTCPVCGEPMTRRNADGTLGCNLCYAMQAADAAGGE